MTPPKKHENDIIMTIIVGTLILSLIVFVPMKLFLHKHEWYILLGLSLFVSAIAFVFYHYFFVALYDM